MIRVMNTSRIVGETFGMDEHKPRHLERLSRFVRRYSKHYQRPDSNDRDSLDSRNDWTSQLEQVWGDHPEKYARIEHFFHEAEDLRLQLPDVDLTADDFERRERWECVMEEFSDELDSVETLEQKMFVMQNLPFEIYRPPSNGDETNR